MSEEGVTRREFFRQNYGAVDVCRGNMPKVKKHARFLQCSKMPQSVGPCFCNFVARYTTMAIMNLQIAVFNLLCSSVTDDSFRYSSNLTYNSRVAKVGDSPPLFHPSETGKLWLVD